MRGRVVARSLSALAVVATMLSPASAPAGPGSGSGVERGALISGTTQYVDGTHVWTDYAYDDFNFRGERSPGNTADLIQLQVGKENGDVRVRAILQTMPADDSVKVAVAFDTHTDPLGTGVVPDVSWTHHGRVDLALTMSASGATLRRFSSVQPPGPGSWSVVDDQLPVTFDTATNSITARIPRVYADPGRSTWTVAAGVGGLGPYDLAYVTDDGFSGWQDAVQRRAMQGLARPAEGRVDFAKVEDGVTELPAAAEPGLHTRLYRSSLALGGGIRSFEISVAGRPVPLGSLYAGPYQPYVVWVPEDLPPDPPLIVYMHGLSQTHTSNVNHGFDVPAIIAMPLGRGEMTFYLGAAEQDVLDVTDDAIAAFGVDPDRVVLSGVSMGGFGAFRLGALHPDRWSSIVPLIGTSQSAQSQTWPAPLWGSMLDLVFPPSAFPSGAGELLWNLRNVPVRMVNGQLDPIVDPEFPTKDAVQLTHAEIDHRAWMLTRRHHEVVPALTNCVLREAVARHGEPNPIEISHTVSPALDVDDPATGLRLRHNRAYWLSQIAVVRGAGYGRVYANSSALGDSTRRREVVAAVGDNVTEGRDLCGPAATVRTNDQWRMTGLEVEPERRIPGLNLLSLSLHLLASVRVDVNRAGLALDEPVLIAANSSGDDTEIELRGDWLGPVDVWADDVYVGRVTPQDGIVRVALEATPDQPQPATWFRIQPV